MQCPACKRKIENEESCPRCGMNLTDLKRFTRNADRLILQGKRCLARKSFKDSLIAFQIANSLCGSSTAKKGIITSLICLGSYRRALRTAVKYGYLDKLLPPLWIA